MILLMTKYEKVVDQKILYDDNSTTLNSYCHRHHSSVGLATLGNGQSCKLRLTKKYFWLDLQNNSRHAY